MELYQIKDRFSGKVIFEGEYASFRACVEVAVKANADLRNSNLRNADLRNSNLRNANLESADLENANLESANLRNANLESADLENANLESANLRNADLENANLRNANLESANLRNANLESANLRNANLRKVKGDFKNSIRILPAEILFLKTAIVEGRVDGSQYNGECACLAGTFANAKGVHYKELENKFGFAVDVNSPRERWFLAIKKGDTPENNQVSKITLGWIDEVLEEFQEEGFINR